MANDANKVSVGKPKVTGAIFRAPAGTALPTDATTALADTSKGRVSGISGNVDLDVMYAAYYEAATSKPSNGSGVRVDDSKTDYAQSFAKSYAGQYTTTADLHLRAAAGTSKRSITVLPEGTAVRCYGYYTRQSDGTVWLYVVATVGGVKYTGFCGKGYLKKA